MLDNELRGATFLPWLLHILSKALWKHTISKYLWNDEDANRHFLAPEQWRSLAWSFVVEMTVSITSNYLPFCGARIIATSFIMMNMIVGLPKDPYEAVRAQEFEWPRDSPEWFDVLIRTGLTSDETHVCQSRERERAFSLMNPRASWHS